MEQEMETARTDEALELSDNRRGETVEEETEQLQRALGFC